MFGFGNKNKKDEKKRRKKEDNFEEVENEVETPKLDEDTWLGIVSVGILGLSLLLLLAMLDLAGNWGGYLKNFLIYLSGWLAYFFPLLILVIGATLFKWKIAEIKFYFYIGFILFWLSLSGLVHLLSVSDQEIIQAVTIGRGGGYLGMIVNYPLRFAFGGNGTLVILLVVFLISLMVILNKSLRALGEMFMGLWRSIWGGDDVNIYGEVSDETEEENELIEDRKLENKDVINLNIKKIENNPVQNEKMVIPEMDDNENKNIKLDEPKVKFKKQTIELPIDILKSEHSKPISGNIKKNLEIIQKTLENFKIPVQMGDVRVGPSVSQYMLKPSEGIKLTRLRSLGDDLSLSLAAHPIRIEAPIPGTSWVGVEVPNKGTATVKLKDILETPHFKGRNSNLMLPLGKDVSGKAWLADLGKMPHLLIAGATGSGKSVCLNALILGLLYQHTPETLRFIMVDPKRVEFSVYNDIPHLLTPVITDPKKTVNALKWLIGEMERRYEVLAKDKKRNIASYNEDNDEKLPYIVLVIDEMADLMMTAASAVEPAIIRLAQMARAVGIHLILATQRPSVNVITGLIKANIPARIAFSVTSVIDSRTILDLPGAEKLIGRGDMLFLPPELSKPIRIQGCYISDNEIKDVVDFLKDQIGDPQFIENVVENQKTPTVLGGSGDLASDGEDELWEEAAKVVIESKRASTSFIQRKLRVGYSRAARLLDILEEKCIVGAADGSRARVLLVKEWPLAGTLAAKIVPPGGINNNLVQSNLLDRQQLDNSAKIEIDEGFIEEEDDND